MKFPPVFLEQLRSRVTLSEVIGRRIPVKRHGREYQALCPFHKEKTPSFTINDDKGFYHCFGCQAHGDAIGFLKDYENIGWPEAVEKLAGEVGMALPVVSKAEEERYQRVGTIYDLMDAACAWFESQRHTHSVAKEYLQQRGLKEETLRTFRIGFAPAGRDSLKQAMIAKGFSEQLLVQAGLVAVPDDGRPYDRFRERIMFPIRDVRGKIIAFGGRILPSVPNADKLAKYVNSPETELFHKGEVLFNLDLAKKSARDVGTVIVTEGYLDVIALWQAGITYAVAPLGTALTERHVELLWKLVPEPVICLDGDVAGRRAMAKVANLAVPLLKPSLSFRFAVLPRGEDPDSMIRKHGIGAFRECMSKARPLSEAVWATYSAALEQNTPERKAALEHALMQLTETIQDKTVRNHYRSFFQSKIWPKKDAKKANGASHLMTAAVNPVAQTEALMLKLLLLCPDLAHWAEIEEALARTHFSDGMLERVKQAIITETANMPEIDSQALVERLLSMGVEEEVRKILALGGVDFNKSIGALGAQPASEKAMELWQKLWGKYCSIQTEAEFGQLVRNMTQDPTNADFEKFLEIGKQIRQDKELVGVQPEEAMHEKIA